MKLLLCLLGIFYFTYSSGQNHQTIGTPNTLVVSKGGLTADSALLLPRGDTTNAPYKDSLGNIRYLNGNIFWKANNGIRNKWSFPIRNDTSITQGGGFKMGLGSKIGTDTLKIGYTSTGLSTDSVLVKGTDGVVRKVAQNSVGIVVAGLQTTITGGDTINTDPRSYSNLVFDHFLGNALSSAWTNNAPNTTVTVNNGYVSLVGGSATDIITNSYSSILHRWTYELKTVIKSVGSGDYFLFSIQSPTGGGPVVCRVKFSDLSGNWYYLNTGFPLGTTSAQGTTSINDTVYLRLIRDNFTLTYQIENRTKGTIQTSAFTFNNILATNVIIPFRDFSIALNPFAGSINIEYVKLLNQERIGADFMIIGHSIAEGFNAIVPDSCFYNRLQNLFNKQRFSLYARSGATVANYNASYVPQLLIQQPKNVIVLLGINEINNGVTSNTFINNIKTLIDTLEQYNINVKVSYVTPSNAADKDTVIAFNNALISNFGYNRLINIYDTLEVNGLLANSVDSLHPNAIGHRYMYQIYTDSIQSIQNHPIILTGPYVYNRAIYTQGVESSGRQSDFGQATMVLNVGNSGTGYPTLGYNTNYTTTSNVYKYRISDYASILEVGAGLNYSNVAAPGIGGNSITYLPRWIIDQNGFVGLGIQTPLTFLHIKKLGSTSTPIGNSPWLIFDETLGANNTKQEIDMGYLNGNPYSPAAFGYVENINANFTTGDFYWALRTAANESSGALATEHMRLTHEGRLGLGTSTPAQRLQVHGQVQIDTLTTGTAGTDSVVVTNAGVIKKVFNTLPIHGNSTTTGTATTVVTVTIGSTRANTDYFVSIAPQDLLTAVNYYISAKTTTTFDVTFVSALTGSINFDWLVSP